MGQKTEEKREHHVCPDLCCTAMTKPECARKAEDVTRGLAWRKRGRMAVFMLTGTGGGS